MRIWDGLHKRAMYVGFDHVSTLQMDGAPTQLWNEETILETPNTVDSTEPPISCEGEGEVEGDAMEEDVMADILVGEEKDLVEDDLREYHKVDFVNTIASLKMKPTNLF